MLQRRCVKLQLFYQLFILFYKKENKFGMGASENLPELCEFVRVFNGGRYSINLN